MQRNLEAMAAKKYDVLVIGGGISGAAIAHDAALRGLSVALVEKGDFGGATSAATSKLIHGGLRYMKTFEFGLVRESLRERRTMEYIAPHIVGPIPFMVPNYSKLMQSKLAMVPAMFLYDKLSFDKADLDDLDRRVPGWENYGKEETLTKEGGLKTDGLSGSVVYYDCQMYSSVRLTLEFILGAAENGADLANYTRVENLLRKDKDVEGAAVVDVLSNKKYEIRADITINAAGPWADCLTDFIGESAHKKLVRSQGIHIITKKITNNHALVLTTKTGRLFFILPWRGYSLIGTTDTKWEGNPDEYCVDKKDILHFIDEINEAYPSANLTIDDVQWSYGGLRPIVEQDTTVKDVNKASRKYEIYDHKKDDGVGGVISVIGGKYTTSRSLAQSVVDMAARKMNLPVPTHATAGYILPGGRIGSYAGFRCRLMRDYGVHADDAIHWTRTYGAHCVPIFEAVKKNPKLGERIDERHVETWAVVDRAVKDEMAVTLDDVLFRRTGLGTTGELSDKSVRAVADRMKTLLRWTKKQCDAEKKAAIAKLKSKGMTG